MSEGVLIPWDKFQDVLDCINDASKYNWEGYLTEKRKRGDNRSQVMMDLWKRDHERVRLIGNMLMDQYKAEHPDAEPHYAKPIEEV